jgi:hypothetical protein
MKQMRDYDNWKLHTPDNDLKVFCHCEHCGNEIYEDEEYIEVSNGDKLHYDGDCYHDYARELLDPTIKVAGE